MNTVLLSSKHMQTKKNKKNKKTISTTHLQKNKLPAQKYYFHGKKANNLRRQLLCDFNNETTMVYTE